MAVVIVNFKDPTKQSGHDLDDEYKEEI